VLIGAAVFANLTVSVTELYEGSLLQCYRAFGSDIKALFRESLSSVSYPGPDGEVYSVPEELLNILIENAVMISPAAAVVTCELLAYISVRVLRFAARLTGRDRLLFPAVYELTISVPTAALYLIALAVSFFSESASVVAYSAINITYIMMPVACGAGFNMLLGKRGIMRGRLSKGSRTVVTVMCVILAVTSPLSFFQMLAMFASIYTVVRTVMEAVKSRTDGE